MIQRDGYCISLWQEKAQPYQPVNLPDPDRIYDVIIVGGGITGVSTALLLQEAGKKCLLLEAAGLCFGTTGGTTAHLNTLLDTPYHTIKKNFGTKTAQQVAKATAEAIQLIKYQIDKYSIDCAFEEANAYLLAQGEQQEKELLAISGASLEAGLELTYTADIDVPIPFTQAIRVAGQARFHPVKYVSGLAEAFERAGGVILQDCRVNGIERKERVYVESEKGLFKTIGLVYATHIPPGINLLHLRCAPYRSYAMAVTLEDQKYPNDLYYDMEDPYNYFRTQWIDDRPYLIAGGKDHKTGHQENTSFCFTELEATVRRYFKVKEINHQWSSQYYEPADGLPYIGHLPGSSEHIYVATGFSGNGMVYSSVAALLLKQLITKQKAEYKEVFNPNRIKPVAGFTNFIRHNAGVAGELLQRLGASEKLEQLAELAPGEAKVVELEKDKIALYVLIWDAK
jgi:glycine/D-amino acid oxidase-like deaminating enzyme